MREPAVDEVVAALAAAAGPVEVVGDGALARALRTRLGDARDARPAAIVETSGDGQAIQEALRRVAPLGTVVLAGPPPAGPVALDLYADLHVRGLTLVGVPPPQPPVG